MWWRKAIKAARSIIVPHIKNGKATMVPVEYRPVVNRGKKYPFASERQNARYMRAKRRSA